MFTAVVLTAGAGPRVISAATGRELPKRPTLAASESLILQFQKVSELLKSGQAKEAEQLLDQIGGEPLIVEGSTTGDGVLQNFSPIGVLMNLTKQMGARARLEAENGRAKEALCWISRCHELSAQVLATPKQNLDSLHAARSLDIFTGRTEVAVLKLLHEDTAAARVASRENRFNEYYQQTIHRQVRDLPEIGSMTTTPEVQAILKQYQVQRLRLSASNATNEV